MSAIADTQFQEILDIFETGGTKGMMKDEVDEIPTMIFTQENNNTDTSGVRICCSVCLQVSKINPFWVLLTFQN